MNNRKDNNGVNMTKWKRTKPALLVKPFHIIVRETCGRDTHTGRLVYSTDSEDAFHAARRGDGLKVKQIARAVLLRSGK